MTEELEQEVVTTKSPHYFLVQFDESFTSVNGSDAQGKCYPITCDGFTTNVYGFHSEKEAADFDVVELRQLLRGSRTQKLMIDAEENDEGTLHKKINELESIKNGTYKFVTAKSLPSCARMYEDVRGNLYCGKPQGEYRDGCYGGCVLQGYHQDPEFHDGFRCPAQ